MSEFNYFTSVTFGAIFTAAPFVIAMLLGITLPAVVAIYSNFSRRWPAHWHLAFLFCGIMVGSTLSIATSGRILYSQVFIQANPTLLAMTERVEGSVWVSRFAHLIALSTSAAVIFSWLTRHREMVSWQKAVWGSAMFYFFTSIVVSGIFGNFRMIELRVFYAPLTFTAIALLASTGSLTQTLMTIRWALFLPLAGSLVAMIVAPSLVLESGYPSLIPGLTIRLAGLTPHANSLGLIALIALYLEFSFQGHKPNILCILVALANLVLAQSKTMWLASIAGAVIYLFNAKLFQLNRKQKYQFTLAWVSTACIALAVALFGLFVLSDRFIDFLQADRTGLTTFTGRTVIWQVTLDEFFKSPLFGYGPALWDPIYRFEKGMLQAGQAHNQYVQILGQAGLLGALGLAIYLFFLLIGGYRGSNATNGLSLFLVVVLMVRGFSETPMRMIGIMDADNFVHMFAFYVVAATGARINREATEGLAAGHNPVLGTMKNG
jgi:O-antigen ligase